MKVDWGNVAAIVIPATLGGLLIGALIAGENRAAENERRQVHRVEDACRLRLSLARTNADSVAVLEWSPKGGYFGKPTCAYWLTPTPAAP